MDPRLPWAKVRTFVPPLIEGHPGIGHRSIVGVGPRSYVCYLPGDYEQGFSLSEMAEQGISKASSIRDIPCWA